MYMTNIIVLFPKAKDAGNVRSLLVRHGFLVSSVCTTGAQALAQANVLGDGILVCGYKYPDMIYSELRTALPSHFEMILVASQRVLSECGDPDLICITLPIKVRDLLNTIDLMAEQIARRKKRLRQKPKIRSEEEKRILLEAKSLLMERNHMSEEEAHRYIQKCSMDSGTNLMETARMVLSLMNF
jgi:hypothetical protein